MRHPYIRYPEEKYRKFYKWTVWWKLKIYFTLYFYKKYKVKINLPKEVKKIKKPFFLLATHYGWIDPFLIGSCFKDPIHYVASLAYFKDRKMRKYMYYRGSIPKQKNATDYMAIKDILSLIRSGKSVGIFPEGSTTWYGHTLPIVPSTAKLIKKMKVPVITTIVKGMYSTNPRWSMKIRKASVELDFKLSFTPAQLENLSEEDIFKQLKNDLQHDDIEYQRQKRTPILTKDRAKYVTKVLFWCPRCHAIESMRLVGKDKLQIQCQKCGYHVLMDEYGFFVPFGVTKNVYFDNVKDWSAAASKDLPNIMNNIQKLNHKEQLYPIFMDRGMFAYSTDTKPVQKIGKGALLLFTDSIKFHGDNGEIYTFPMENIHFLNVLLHENFEFSVGGTAYQMLWENIETSGLKWQQAINILHNIPVNGIYDV